MRKATACIALAAVGFPGHAAADVIVFDNSNITFQWTPTIDVGQIKLGSFLDITQPAELQTGSEGPGKIGYLVASPTSSKSLVPYSIFGDLDGKIAKGDPVFIGDDTFLPAKVFQVGDSVGTDVYSLSGDVIAFSFANQIPLLGDRAIVGIQLTKADGVHFGWIEVTLISQPLGGPMYQPTAWAYETEPGVPAIVLDPHPCTADVNGDGDLTPADFTAWIAAFNRNAQACDQNGDGNCSQADFNAWIANFNAGC